MTEQLLRPEEVGARIADRLRRESGIIDVRPGRAGTLEIDYSAGGLQRSFGIGLDNVYRMYLSDPSRLDQLIETLALQVRELPTTLNTQAEGAEASNLLPLLKDAAFLRSAAQQGSDLITRPFAASLSVVYVADLPTAVRFLTRSDLAASGWSAERLHAQALANLERRAVATPLTLTGEGPRRLIQSTTGDGYDASRILLPDLQDRLAAHLGGALVFGVPHRDALFVLTDHDREFVRTIARRVRDEYESRSYPLAPGLFCVQDGTVVEYPQT